MVALDGQEGEGAGGIGSGVDVDPVGSKLRLGDRGVAVHDEFAEVFLACKKFIADPEQVFGFLLPQRDARFHAGMDKQEIAAEEGRLEIVEEAAMGVWDLL